VTFRVKRDPVDKAYPFSPYVHLQDPDKSIVGMEDAEQIVLPCRNIIVIADYPLRSAFSFPLKSADDAGFTRAELARQIGAIYQHIYAEEEKTTRQPIIPPDQRQGLANRNGTDGTYGIWGHDLGDLDLSAVTPELRDGVVYVRLEIDS